MFALYQVSFNKKGIKNKTCYNYYHCYLQKSWGFMFWDLKQFLIVRYRKIDQTKGSIYLEKEWENWLNKRQNTVVETEEICYRTVIHVSSESAWRAPKAIFTDCYSYEWIAQISKEYRYESNTEYSCESKMKDQTLIQYALS